LKTYIYVVYNFQALKCLRRKKLLDARHAQHEQTIEKINTMLYMLQETESQKQVEGDELALGPHSLCVNRLHSDLCRLS